VTTTAQSRVQVIETPILAPGHCILCGSVGGDDRKFLDFGKSIKWFGAVYFCTFCFRDFAEAAGFIPVDSFDSLHNELRALQIKFDQMVAKYKPVADVLEQFSNASNSSSDVDTYSVLLSKFEASREGAKTESRATSGTEEGDSETNESTNVEGSDDLFDSTDFD
jgi:hypothetical protein